MPKDCFGGGGNEIKKQNKTGMRELGVAEMVQNWFLVVVAQLHQFTKNPWIMHIKTRDF